MAGDPRLMGLARNEDGLLPRQQAFVDAYAANGGNATQAAIAAGYSENRAAQQGAALVRNSKVANVLAKHREVVANVALRKIEIDREAVLRGLYSIALDRNRRDAARVRAYHLLGIEIGMFVQRHHVLHDDVARIVDEVAREHGFDDEQREQLTVLSRRLADGLQP